MADIGIPPSVLTEIVPRLHENRRLDLPAAAADTHKYRRGHAIVWSGPALATGAARLTAKSAAAAGAGVVSIAGPASSLHVQAAHVSSIMLKPVERADDVRTLIDDRRVTALCVGPAAGMTDATRKTVLRVLKSNAAVVLDADALSVFADEPSELFRAIAARSAETVLTPHEGEFQRLFAGLAHVDNKVARAAMQRVSPGCRALQGAGYGDCAPDGRAVINGNGTPKLAVAGSGDVLAGIITGLLAQGMTAFDAAAAGAWLHADAAQRCNHPVAEDLIAAL